MATLLKDQSNAITISPHLQGTAKPIDEQPKMYDSCDWRC